jgi:intracellular sulfur oxidation DsrE/DsrF family protein
MPVCTLNPEITMTRSNLYAGIYAGLLAAALTMTGCATSRGGDATANVATDNVVYHVSDVANASAALRNIGNHLEVNPRAHIIVVTHAQGVDFLMDGAKDGGGNPYNIRVEELKSQGVQFDVCEITLRNRKLDKNRFIPEATFVPSGVAEIAKLQQRQGYAYIKP